MNFIQLPLITSNTVVAAIVKTMLIITVLFERALSMAKQSDAEFNESQLIRMRYILSAKEAGAQFYELRKMFQAAPKNQPILTDMGEFSSFNDFLDKQNLNRSTIYNYIKLYENWDIVLKLGMQNADNVEDLGKSMRVCRTLKVINWYKKEKGKGRPEEELTIKQYWIDNEAQLEQKKLEALEKNEQLSMLKTEVETLREENRSLKLRLLDLEKQLQQLQQKPSLQAQLQALKDKNAELFV